MIRSSSLKIIRRESDLAAKSNIEQRQQQQQKNVEKKPHFRP